MAARRDYAGGAVAANLASNITSSSTTINLAASPGATGWPTGANGEFFVVIDRGVAGLEEKMLVLSRSALTLTLASSGKRGADGTTAVAHSAGATVEHCLAATDLDEANALTSNPAAVGVITSSARGDAASAGVATSWARGDHKHARETEPAKFHLTTSADQGISSGSHTALLWNSEVSDTNNGHSTSSNTSRYTIPAGFAGMWLFTATVDWQSVSDTSYRTLMIAVNGGYTNADHPVKMEATMIGVGHRSTVSGLINGLVVGDYVEAVVLHTSSGTATLLGATPRYFAGVWIRS